MAVSSVSGESDSVTCSILTISRAELQQLNFDRIFPELEEKGVLPKGFTNIMKPKAASEKSNVLKTVLQAKDDKEFRTFLEAVADEDDEHFLEPTLVIFPSMKTTVVLLKASCYIHLMKVSIRAAHA